MKKVIHHKIEDCCESCVNKRIIEINIVEDFPECCAFKKGEKIKLCFKHFKEFVDNY